MNATGGVASARSAALALGCGLALLAPCAFAQGFPPIIDLRSLFPDAGGDGTIGVVFEGVNAGDRSGSVISGAGDVNGDGINDLFIGAQLADPDGRKDAGESYVVFGRKGGFPATVELRDLFPIAGGDGSKGFVLQGVGDGDRMGLLRDLGDVNGDGIDDIIVGAVGADPEGVKNAGQTYVIFGRTTGFPPVIPVADLLPENGGDGSAGFAIDGVRVGDALGQAGGAGDVNGDGINDIMVAAVQADPNGQDGAGEVYVVFGRRYGFPARFKLRRLFPAIGGNGTEGFVLQGAEAGDRLRISAIRSDDINGDGIDDLLLGAEFADSQGRTDVGEAYVVFGRITGFPPIFKVKRLFPIAGGDGTEGFVLQGVDAGDTAGRSACGLGDIDGDGINDFVIGAYKGGPNNSPEAGEGYLLYGRTTPFPAVFDLRTLFPAFGGNGNEGFVVKGINAGDRAFPVLINDVNGDGIDEMLYGAQLADPEGRIDAGASYVLFGRNTRFPASYEFKRLLPSEGGDGSEGFVIEGVNAGDEFGYTITGVGDVNGDGNNDLFIGARLADPNGREDAGESYVIYGRK